MKHIIIVLLCTCLSYTITAQNIIGAWETQSTSKDNEPLKQVAIFTEGYHVITTYHATTGKFMYTNGGAWQLTNNTLTETLEFDSAKPERVGTQIKHNIKLTDQVLEFLESKTSWHRLDHGKPGKLNGAWLMSGRVKAGETQLRDTNKPRKTMKILSGTRFQWMAYNTESKAFMGTGGGTYTTDQGVYTEHIEFFSKDNSKTGLELKFNYELIDGAWHHTGFSSKGDPIHEIWRLR
ncbi:membrane or secreted protein [Formosa sediminum]|uniref:Membrane or secreted protein n=1 Tax=Formosa sediminum TaxID=2594004 RepID=A0A516GSH5_9FLAO|nr:membrane or secreted protein [Formosa sediminum]QDO94477.1 membrane or secreted protein [Formosa sediminum]